MKTYFHYNVRPARKRLRTALVLIIAPLFQAGLLAMLTLVFTLSAADSVGSLILLCGVVCAAVLLGMLLCWLLYEITAHRIAVNSRYTYFDILPKALVFSRYGGSHSVNGERRVIRELYVVPLVSFREAVCDEKGKRLEIRGEVRKYIQNSDSLGYHVADGELTFDNWWLDHGGYESAGSVKIPPLFGSAPRLAAEIAAAKKRFDEIPPPKPHVFREADFIRRRPKPRVMPEELSYNRKW